jgi:molybdopterin-synthase adenylyltransferase
MTAQMSDYYVRQAILPHIGQEGMARLRSSTVAIVGVGGVGSSTAYYLSRSGVGRIRLIDQDIIEPSNLQRIHSATRTDLFLPKAEVLSRRLTEFDSSAKIEAIVDTITSQNTGELLAKTDLILDGLDNFRTRYILNKFAIKNQIPYLFSSAVAEQAHIALLNPPHTPCLECVMPSVADRFNDSCEMLGVSPAITALAGTIAAQTTIQFLLGTPTRLEAQLMTIDTASLDVIFTKLSKNRSCQACQNTSPTESQSTTPVTFLCGEHTANILPPVKMNLNLRTTFVAPSEQILASSDSVLVFRQEDHTVSLFRNGRLLIGNVDQEEEASRIAAKVWKSLEPLNRPTVIKLPTRI